MKNKYLALGAIFSLLTLIILSSKIFAQTYTTLVGDLNYDGIVNSIDFGLFANNYGQNINDNPLPVSPPVEGEMDLTIAHNGNNVEISWNNIPNVDDYRLYYGHPDYFEISNQSLLASLASNQSSYTHENILNDPQGRYVYQLQARIDNYFLNSKQVAAVNYPLAEDNHQAMIAIPFPDIDIGNAQQLADYIGENPALRKWNPENQEFWEYNTGSANQTNFEVEFGDVIFVSNLDNSVVKVTFTGEVSKYRNNLWINSENFAMVPFGLKVTKADQLAANIGVPVNLLKWNISSQAFRFFVPPNTGDNFDLQAADPVGVRLNETDTIPWP